MVGVKSMPLEWSNDMNNMPVKFRREHSVKRILGSVIFALISFNAFGEGYQELSPIAVHKSDGGGLYIVMEQNIGENGCNLNKNSVHLRPDEHTEKFIDSALSIALASIASKTNIKVYWNGCLSNGRPKATVIGYGTAEMN